MKFFLSMALPWRQGNDTNGDLSDYRRIWRFAVTLTLLVSLAPLLVMTAANHLLYRKSAKAEIQYEISRNITSISRSLEFIVEERTSALELLISENSQQTLASAERLALSLKNLKQSFGSFVDLELIDAQGDQQVYVGPYDLQGASYPDQTWFHEVALRGHYVSDVFLGHRQFPHFVIAVKHEIAQNGYYVLRATLDMELLNRLISYSGIGRGGDIFMVNRDGVLQTPSRYHGELLGRFEFFREWLRDRSQLLMFALLSTLAIIAVVLWSSTVLVRRIRAADIQRAQVIHNAEYTNKMATIGRLAATVAHEINNPLAIINEKAGLLKDMVQVADDFPNRQNTLASADSIISSVRRCSDVTHRLLGFTRRMESHVEHLNLAELLEQVLGFLGKEASHRNIEVVRNYSADMPAIYGDRGKLQQIFLNIINNAIAALPGNGQIELDVRIAAKDRVTVSIADNGPGIPAADLDMIFEPFYSTKGEFGTGLGLSITYGMVKSLGGTIDVKSQVGHGTCFTVSLPVDARESQE
jgi:signal transduction histidine kinase